MNFNTFLLRLGIDPDNFKNILTEPIKTEKGYEFHAEQRTDNRKCIYCNSTQMEILGYYHVRYRCSENNNIEDILRVKKVRFKCNECRKTFTPKLNGIEPYSSITNQTKQLIISDFYLHITFQSIADKYHISNGYAVKLFDETFKYVPRTTLPSVLCIDEFHFSREIDQKYCCVISDFHKRVIVDIIKNRQLAYLREYFSSIKPGELDNVKVFISDMYDAYATIKNSYFPKAIHVIDLFHVIIQLSRVVNKIRVRAMNLHIEKGTKEYNFMKVHWKQFLCRRSEILDKFYTCRATGEIIHYDDMTYQCIKKNDLMLRAYNILQDLYKYTNYDTYSSALSFIIFISTRLIDTGNEDLMAVGKTYHKWRNEIANSFAKHHTGLKLTNGIAEGLNNQIKTILKMAYGYHNFERFRKRSLLILRDAKVYKKE